MLDEPSFVFPDGSRLGMRMTLIYRREDDAWKMLHMHASIGVPDEEAQELQARWEAAT